ncbi:hypothetical protein [Pseudobutyrivibrio sp. JW11]|uniref:hypothetical protein n=1 Tax=Pseudobutyrivibrio sp. JW11 TaxID=1855302 RepID=UPI000B841B8E|nr:hypothetical protein [Pseudobutyrivibrio sp. JW11]
MGEKRINQKISDCKFYVDGYGILLYNVTVDVVRRLASISPEAGFTITFLAGARTSPAWELF